MSEEGTIDFGPLTGLIGVWKGDKGLDIAPEKVGLQENPYFETITYSAVGDVTNAGAQTLSVIHYQQIVQRKSNSETFHHENGYWMWDPKEETIMHSLIIPRGVCVLAGGKYTGKKDPDGNIILEVSAEIGNPNWSIVQSPFMLEKARTKEFRHLIILGNGTLSYSETTVLDIYGREIEHTDDNVLVRV